MGPSHPLGQYRSWSCLEHPYACQICALAFSSIHPQLWMRLFFDKLEPDKLVGAFFLDRAAMKVPDIDANCDCMFTNPEEIQKVWFGGRWKAKGFGFAPKCRTLFQAGGFLCLYSKKKLCTSSWSWWMDENEKVFRTDNISELWKYGQENLPEILSKQLYQPQHQCLVALSILRPCGHFVCKPERYSQEILCGADRDSYFGCSGGGERRCGHGEDFPACTWKAQDLQAGAGKHVTGKRVQGWQGPAGWWR